MFISRKTNILPCFIVDADKRRRKKCEEPTGPGDRMLSVRIVEE